VILVDTGVLFGAVDRDDPRHRDCAAVLEAHAGSLAVSVPVLIESAWLIESRLGPTAEAATQESSSASTSPTPTGSGLSNSSTTTTISDSVRWTPASWR